jgi:acetoacetate decarboxylase
MDKTTNFFAALSIVLMALSLAILWYGSSNQKIEIVYKGKKGNEFKFRYSPNDSGEAEKLVEAFPTTIDSPDYSEETKKLARDSSNSSEIKR